MKTFQLGYRPHDAYLRKRDLALLLAGLALGMGVSLVLFDLGVLILFAVLHFLLFCNVFRVHPHREYAWAVVFCVNALLCSRFLEAHMPWIILIAQVPITLAVIAFELRSPNYHGVGSRSTLRERPHGNHAL